MSDRNCEVLVYGEWQWSLTEVRPTLKRFVAKTLRNKASKEWAKRLVDAKILVAIQ